MLNHKAIVILCIYLMSVCASNYAAAQTTVAIGSKLGPSFSSLIGDDAGDPDRRTGFTGGLFVNISPLEFLSIQPELLYSQRGATNVNEFWNARQTISVNYLEIPVLIKLRLPIKGIVYPHIYAGPIFSKKLSSKYELQQLNTHVDITNSNFDSREFDFGGVFGFGVDVEVSRLFITADLRYGVSALNIDESDEGLDLKNTEIMALVGVGILIGK